MKNLSKGKLKNTTTLAMIWVLFSLLILGGSTVAWFTFNSATNVNPLAGTVGNGGADLLISNRYDGEFSNLTELIMEGNPENLQPVSTSDTEHWFTSIGQNSSGISKKFKDISEHIDETSMYGTVYLKSDGGSSKVYLNETDLKFPADPQLLSSCRLVLEFQSESIPRTRYIFNFDSIVNSERTESVTTIDSSNSVISAVDDAGNPEFVPDPAVSFKEYGATVEEETITAVGSPLCIVPENEVVTVSYRLYMEGCDENCINAAQDQTLDFSLAFAGIGSTEKKTAE